MAAKVAECGGKSQGAELLQEAMVLKALQRGCGFPEFIGLFTAELDANRFMVLQRFRCSVEDLRRENPSTGGLSITSVQTVGMQVLSQLQAMHQLNLAHGDLKPKNIAVASVNPLKILRFSEQEVLFISWVFHGLPLFFLCTPNFVTRP